MFVPIPECPEDERGDRRRRQMTQRHHDQNEESQTGALADFHGFGLKRLSEKGTGPFDSCHKSLFLGARQGVLSPFRTASQVSPFPAALRSLDGEGVQNTV